MTQSGGFVILNKVKNPFGNSLLNDGGMERSIIACHDTFLIGKRRDAAC
jgi:hypothetical protein